ncbi:MAG: redoxin domain-containing protein [Isosphaeraceae bacterium]
MVELGELEAHANDFARRQVRVVVVSDDDQPTARLTQADFPHLTVVSDAAQDLARAMDVLHAGSDHEGKETNAPTTFLIDGRGVVRWFFRPERFITRLPARDFMAAIDRVRPAAPSP